MPKQEDRRDAWREVETVREALAGATGAELMRDLSSLARSRRIFDANEREFQGYLAQLNEPEVWLPIQDQRHPKRFDQMLDEVDRLFHNFLAIDFSFVQHTMALRNKHVADGSELAVAYKARIPETPFVKFVHELRVIAQHWRMPLTEAKLSFERTVDDEVHWDHTLQLDRRGLVNRDWRDPIAKAYFETMAENPALGPLVRQYAQGQQEFSDWFVGAFIEVNLDNFEEFAHLQERLARAGAVLEPPS